MILLLDTSTPTCKLAFVDGKNDYSVEWEAGRSLADGLLGFMRREMEKQHTEWDDLTGLGVFRGPGSFTGLRIGITVLNTIAESKQIPIVGTTGDDWRKQAIERVSAGENDALVLPFYGREANITKPRR